MYEAVGKDMPRIQDGDLALISQELDFVGINYYSRNVINAAGKVEKIDGSEYTENENRGE